MKTKKIKKEGSEFLITEWKENMQDKYLVLEVKEGKVIGVASNYKFK